MIDFNNHIFKKCYLTEDLIEYIKNNYSILLKECVNDVCEDKFISMYEYLCYIQSIPYYGMKVKYTHLGNYKYVPKKLIYDVCEGKTVLSFYFIKSEKTEVNYEKL